MAFTVLEGAWIVGDVRIGDCSSVWYNAVLRGDLEPIEIGCCSNIQDNCVVHTSHGYPVRSVTMYLWDTQRSCTGAWLKITSS